MLPQYKAVQQDLPAAWLQMLLQLCNAESQLGRSWNSAEAEEGQGSTAAVQEPFVRLC